MSATEDGVTDLMADYLRNNDIQAVTQVSISGPGTRDQLGFQVDNGGLMLQTAAYDYSDSRPSSFGFHLSHTG